MKVSEQACSNCRYARSTQLTEGDTMLSCRYNPPTPGSRGNAWRVVPEDFWCGKWEEGGVWQQNEKKPLTWRPD